MATVNNTRKDGFGRGQSLPPTCSRAVPDGVYYPEAGKLAAAPTYTDPVSENQARKGRKEGRAALVVSMVALVILVVTMTRSCSGTAHSEDGTPRSAR